MGGGGFIAKRKRVERVVVGGANFSRELQKLRSS